MSKKKVQKDKQRSTKHTYKTKYRVTRTPLKTGGELRCSGRESSSCSTSDTRRVNLVTNQVISHERGKDREVFTTSGTYPWSFVTQIFHNGQPRCGGDRKTFNIRHKTQNKDKQVKSTTEKSKMVSNTDPPKSRRWAQIFANDNQFPLHIRHPPVYS